MRLTDATVEIRPRRPWEAIDLGVLIAQRHALLLMSSWALISLPVFALLSLLLWQHPGWAILLFWWLKPLFERLPLHILSRALFGATPSLGASLRAFPGLIKPQLVMSLTLRRFSPVRSFALPVSQLERLSGAQRSERLSTLLRASAAAAGWLTVLGVAIEVCLYFGLIGLIYSLLPQAWTEQLDWLELLGYADGHSLWVEHLSNLLYALILVFWEPIYVACGFTLYLNCRTNLEAWDVELAFRRLRQRLASAAPVLLLCAGLCLLLPNAPVRAEAAAPRAQTERLDPLAPEAPRLTHQPLTSSAARQSIRELVEGPPFQNSQTVERWRFKSAKQQEQPRPETEEPSKVLDPAPGKEKSSLLLGLTLVMKMLIWALVISALVLLIWRYREWLRLFGSRLKLPVRAKRQPPGQLFGLEVAPETLPDDVASVAERLWDEDPRAALGLLYRALLSHLLHDHQIPIRAAHTEGEVLHLTRGLQIEGLTRLADVLTRHWQNLAYGGVLPGPALKRGLCDGWRRQFPGEVQT
jgi:hypothetical protein